MATDNNHVSGISIEIFNRSGGRLLCLSFLSGFRETRQENLFTSHSSACEVWVDSDILENFSRNGTNVIVARSLSIASICSRTLSSIVVPLCNIVVYGTFFHQNFKL